VLFHGWVLSGRPRSRSSPPTNAHIKTHSSRTAALPSHPSHSCHHAQALHLYHNPSTGMGQQNWEIPGPRVEIKTSQSTSTTKYNIQYDQLHWNLAVWCALDTV